MRDHLKRVLEMARPYRGRLVLGLLCGFLSGALAPTLGLSLKLAVDAVFPTQVSETNSVAGAGSQGITSQAAANPAQAQPGAKSSSSPSSKALLSRMPLSLRRSLDRLTSW